MWELAGARLVAVYGCHRGLAGGKALFGSALLRCAAAQAIQLPPPSNAPAALLRPATRRFFDPGLGNRALRRMQRRPRANFQVGAGLGQGRAGPAIKPSMAWVAVVGR